MSYRVCICVCISDQGLRNRVGIPLAGSKRLIMWVWSIRDGLIDIVVCAFWLVPKKTKKQNWFGHDVKTYAVLMPDGRKSYSERRSSSKKLISTSS